MKITTKCGREVELEITMTEQTPYDKDIIKVCMSVGNADTIFAAAHDFFVIRKTCSNNGGQYRDVALYELIADDIAPQVKRWLDELETQKTTR